MFWEGKPPREPIIMGSDSRAERNSLPNPFPRLQAKPHPPNFELRRLASALERLPSSLLPSG